MRLSIIMPVYNERATLEDIVHRVQTVDLTVNSDSTNLVLPGPVTLEREIVIVDDGSTDGTREILDQWRADPPPNMQIIYHERNSGKGAALRTGFQHATGDIFIIQDADLEYDPRDYVKLLEPLLEGRAPVIYGSRFLGGPRAAMSLTHTLGNQFLTIVTNILYGTWLSDMETCYKCFRRDVIDGIAQQSLPVLMMLKESVNRAFESSLNEGLLFERRTLHATFSLADNKEGMAAFLEKRKPRFSHR